MLIPLLAALSMLGQQPVSIPRLAGPVTLDGRSDEAAWSTVPTLPLTTLLPVAGNAPSDRTEIRIAYDDRYIYASGRFYVADSSRIQATTLMRDRLGPDDQFRLVLDTYNDNRTAVAFVVTPSGVRCDYDVTDDGATVDDSWNTYWDAATTRDAAGWYVEMRIPWSSLRFRPDSGGVVMGLIAMRVAIRKNEWSSYPALSPTRANAVWSASAAQKVRFTRVPVVAPLYVTPYLLGGLSSTAATTGDNRPPRVVTAAHRVGGDLKYGLTEHLTLDLTVNTDFAQVEADNEQVNLTRFSLSFPEKRQFFLERAGAFDFNTSALGDGRVFYSRRIGLADDGTPLTIDAGVRLVGNAAGIDIGATDLEVATDSGGTPENIGVVRLRHRVFNDGSYIGGIVTTRLHDRQHNIVSGVDAQWLVRGNDYLVAQATHSDDSRAGGGAAASQLRLDWSRRASRGWIYELDGKWSGRDFVPGLGFESHQDYTRGYGFVAYNWIGRSGVNLQPTLSGWLFARNADGSVDASQFYPYVNFGFPSGFHGWVAWRARTDNVPTALALTNTVTVPAADYRYHQAEFSFTAAAGRRFSYSVQTDIGTLYDGRQTSIDIVPTWSLSPHLTLGAEYQYDRIRFPDRGQYLNADLARVRVTFAMNSRFSAETFAQYSAIGGLGVGNLRIRYQFAEGRDLYVVYNEQLNLDAAERNAVMPAQPLSAAHVWVVKYTTTFAR